MGVLLFFFSSRRRHTRLTCDWSSDVCSSDLGIAPVVGILVDDVASARVTLEAAGIELIGPLQHEGGSTWSHFRSEEHTSELQSHVNLVCRLLLEKKNRLRCCCRCLSYEACPS